MKANSQRLTWLAWLTVLSLLSSCIGSKLDPSENVTVSGTLTNGAGAPVANTRVALLKNPDFGQLLGGLVFFPFSLLRCLDPHDLSPICGHARMATTDAVGRFTYLMTGQDTQGSVEDADLFTLTSQRERQGGELAGPAVMESFYIQVPELQLPGLRFWEPRLALVSTGNQAHIELEEVPLAGYGQLTGTTFSLVDQVGSTLMSLGREQAAQVDMRLLEDKSGGLFATTYATDHALKTDWTFNYASAQVPFTATAGAPPSRGARCFGQSDGVAKELSPCALTDGDFNTALIPFYAPPCQAPDGGTVSCDPATANNWVYVDLGSARSLSLIVVRGDVAGDVLEVSSEGSAWIPLPADTVAPAWVSHPPRTLARYVRVRAQSPAGHVQGLTEISAW